MTVLARELRHLPTAEVKRAAQSVTPTVAAAAQAELDTRPVQPLDAGEAWIRAVFPQRPDPFS
jgi:hypothetical protein